MVSVQQYLNKNYPKENREEVTKLDISNKNLEGELDLTDFVILEELDCSNNQLTSLNIDSCPDLEMIACHDNFLSVLNLSNNLKLEMLNIGNNNFSEQDLSFLSHLVNLEIIVVGNKDEKKIQQGIYNRFLGSFEHLKSLTKLECLDIKNTDIESGIEYLPESLEEFVCSSRERPNSRVKSIHNLFTNDEGIVEVDDYGTIKDFKEKIRKIKKESSKLANKSIASWQEYGVPFLDFTEELTQEWIDKGFSKESCKEWLNIGIQSGDNLSNKNLEGDLDLVDFRSLQEINITGNPQLGKIINKKTYTTIKIKAQEWLEKNYPTKEEKKINSEHKITTFTPLNVEGELIINNFSQLEEVIIFNQNNLTKFQINNCPNLTKLTCRDGYALTYFETRDCPSLENISCFYSQLTKLNFDRLEKLTELNFYANRLTDLNLHGFPNLKVLSNDDEERMQQGVYNRFYSSLEPLRDLNKLELLHINNTNIDSGLEYLSESVKSIYCDGAEENNQLKQEHYDEEEYSSTMSITTDPTSIFSDEEEFQKQRDEYIKELESGLQEREKEINLLKIEIQGLKERVEKISYLEERIKELTKLIKKQKEKIVDAYLYFAPAKELFREKKEPIVKFRKRYDKIHEELESKIKAELEEKISEKQLLLEGEQIQKIITITGNISVNQGHAVFGSIFGDNANLNYNTSKKLIELPIITNTKREKRNS
ncbi:791_t:CDS:2 [Entrophospora sp. SA101]|nr:791_t:CDS:2 [Entrophospora sp. SA101]